MQDIDTVKPLRRMLWIASDSFHSSNYHNIEPGMEKQNICIGSLN